jgi:steroid 5-alpha reductase family enzyme
MCSINTATKRSVIGITATLLVGGLVGIAGSQGSAAVGSISVFALCGVMAYVVNWLVFIPSSLRKTEHYFDLTGSFTYLAVITAAMVLSKNLDLRTVLIGVMVWVWAIRLGSFLFARVKRDGKDGRFDEIKIDPLRFFMTWSIQGLWVFLTLAAALVVITGTERETFGVFAIVGSVVWLIGFLVEAMADSQKTSFKANPANAGRFITSGLWGWSRHPNYFGEIMLWVGIAIMAIPVLSGWGWVALISPVFVSLLLTKASGIPLLEVRADERWGEQPDYQQYKSQTPVLLLRPPRTENHPESAVDPPS